MSKAQEIIDKIEKTAKDPNVSNAVIDGMNVSAIQAPLLTDHIVKFKPPLGGLFFLPTSTFISRHML